MADPLLERLSKEDGVTVTPITPMAAMPSLTDPNEQKTLRTLVSQPGFFNQAPEQRRAQLRTIPSYAQAPDPLIDKFIETGRTVMDRKPGLLQTIWEDLNSPVKAFTGQSLKERFDKTAQDYATGATGKLMQEAAAADRAIKNAGFGGDEAVTPILQANATPEGRRFTHAFTSEAIGLAESPLTYVGLGESAVNGPGAARLVAKIGDAGNIAKEAFAATPIIAKAVGKAGEVAAKGLKGVQTAQLWGTRAFQAQALAGAATSVNNYVKDPTPENAASAIFGVGLGGMVASHLARNTKANYDAGAEAVRIMERARDLAWNEGAMRLHDLPGTAQAEYIKQAANDVFAGVPETRASTLPGKVKAARDKAWRLARTPPVTPESMAAELTPQPAAQSATAAGRPAVATAPAVAEQPINEYRPIPNYVTQPPPRMIAGEVAPPSFVMSNGAAGPIQEPAITPAAPPSTGMEVAVRPTPKPFVPIPQELLGGFIKPPVFTPRPPAMSQQAASSEEPIEQGAPDKEALRAEELAAGRGMFDYDRYHSLREQGLSHYAAVEQIGQEQSPGGSRPPAATPRPPSISQQAPMENPAPSPMPQAALPLDPPKRPGGGHQIVLGAPTRFEVVSQNGPDYMVSGHFAVVPRASVLASHDTTFNETPGFPKEIQPRKRDRAAGQAQVEEIANLLSLHKIAGHPEATGGAPIMNPEDFALEGGNGRMIGVNLAYERGGPQAEKYRNDLIERAAEFGLDPAYVASIQDPVLVRVRSGELPKGVSRRQFAIDTNAPSTGGMSALENATNDRQHLTPEVMALYRPDQELGSQGNADFVRDFFKYAVNKNDRGKLQNKNGWINSDGIKRIGNAIFARAYGDNSLLESMSESTDPDVKNVIKALVDSAPEMIRLDDAIAAGERHPVSISEDIAWAGNQLAQLKRQGIPLKDYFKQGDFLNAPPTPMQTDLLVMLDGFNRSGTKIADVLEKYIEAVHAAGDPRQVGMFEQGDPPKPQDVLEAAIQRVKEAAESKKSAILGKEGKNVPEAQQAGPGEGGEDPGSVAIGGQGPSELGEAAAKSIQSASDQPAASKKVAAKPKSEAAPAEKPKLSFADRMAKRIADALVEAENPKDSPLQASAGENQAGNKILADLVSKMVPSATIDKIYTAVNAAYDSLVEELAETRGSDLSEEDRADLAELYPDLAEKYFGAVDEKAPAKEVVKAAENEPAAVDAVSSGGIGAEVEPASGKVEPDNGPVAEYDGLRPDNNGNVGRDGSTGDRPNGENAAPIDFENKRIVSAGERMIPPSDTSVIPPEIAKYLKPQQLTGAADAISAMNGPETGFLIADGTGAGKSLMSLTVAKHFADKGFSVLIVSKAEAFKFDYETRQPTGTYARWSKTFGIPLEGYVGPERDNFVTKLEPGKVYAATYDTVFGLAPRENPKKPGVFSKGSPGIAHLVGPNTVLIMDEAHAAKNSGGGAENRANASVDMANKAGKVLMMTATPGDKPAHVQYLQRVGLLEGKSQDQQLSELGFKKKVTKGKDGKEVVTWNIDPQVGKRTVRARLDALFSRLMANGQMVKREISMDGVDLQMTPISLPEEGYEIMDMIENRLSDGAGLKNVDGLQKAVILGHMRRAQEGYKIPHIVNMVKEELAEGRKVIIVIELVNDSPVIKRTKVMTPHGIETQEEVIHVNKSTAQALKQALFDIGLTPADIAEIHGGAKESSIEAVERFQNGSAKVAIITGPSGGTGIDLDDQKGNAPRTMIIATPPFEGTANTQLIGREWRLGTKSSPRVRYVFANTATDHWNMGILADKMKTLGVIVKGEAKGAMDFANIQGGEIRPGFVPEGEFIEDDDAVGAPRSAPKALKGKGGKELPPPVEGGWLQLQPANTYENRLKLGKKGLGGEFDRDFTNRWQIPDTQANRDALAQIKGIRIDGPSNYQPKEKPKVEETPEVRAINEKIRADRAAELAKIDADNKPVKYADMPQEVKDELIGYVDDMNAAWDEKDAVFYPRKVTLAQLESASNRPLSLIDIPPYMAGQSRSKGPVVLDSDLSVIDGMHRIATVYADSGYAGTIDALVRQPYNPKPVFGAAPAAGPDLSGAGLISPPKVTPKPPALSPKAKAEAGRQRIRDFYRPGNLVTSYGGGNDRVLAFKENPDGTWDVDVQEEKNGRLIDRPRRHSTPPDKYDKIIESAPGEAPKPPAKPVFGGARNPQENRLATPRPPLMQDLEDEPLRAREQKPRTERPPASFIEKAVNEGGKATMGADIRALAEDLGSSLYKGQDAAVVAKELLQNAMDATRLLGAGVAGEVSVKIDKGNRIIRVTDNGTGMSKGDLETVFVDLGASGKRDQGGASGGFGLAKAAPLMMGKSITVRSIHRSPSGELIESGMTTNKEELLGSGATIWSKPAPQGSSTGTSVEVTMPHSDWNPWFEAEQFATRSLKSIRPPAALKVTVGDGRVVRTKADDSVARETIKPATQLSTTGATADIYFSSEKKGLDLTSAYSVSIEINNNGIFQFETSIYLGQAASLKGMPAVIAVDVKATVKEGHKDYPFTANREALRSDDLTDQIKKYVQDTIIAPAIKTATDFIQHKYDSLQQISRGVVLFDSGARLTSGEIEWLQDDPDFSNLASVINRVTANALYAISQSAEIAGRRNLLGLGSGIERAGIVLSKELHGVHITNPKTGKATIFSNPLSFTEGTSPIKAASLIWHTIKHEILHDKVKGHSEEFTVGLTKVDEALGDSFMDSLTELRDAYADKNDKSKFRGGIIEALRIYTESRGRPERERDPFRGEASRIGKPVPGGIRGTPANVSGGGKAAIREVGGAQPGGSRSDSKRTTRPPVGDPEDEPLRAREQNSDTLGGLIPEGRAKFMNDNVAQVQRGKPESAMLKVQFANGGGVLNLVVEHVGDLTHRMAEEVTSERGGYGYVKDKVEKTLRWLTSPYGFRREHVENIESNARHSGEDPAARLEKVVAALEKYADEHRKIPVFNDVQRWARDAAVLIGERRFTKAVEELQKLKVETDKGPESWAAKAKEVDRAAVEEFLKRKARYSDPEDTPAYARDPDIKWEPGKALAELQSGTPASKRSRGEVAAYLNKQVRKSLGAIPASAGEKAKITRLMNLGRIELSDQLKQKNNGAGFYSKDTPLADANMLRAFPELADPRKLAFQKVLSAVLANNQDPNLEAYYGAQVYEQFRKTGKIPATQPNGKPWPGRGSLDQMQKLERMREEMGVDGLVKFLTYPQRLADIAKWRPSVYVSKARADVYFPGLLVLGDKIGPYWGELMQLPGLESTPIDRWDAGAQYRRLGQLIEAGVPKAAPDNDADRQIFMRTHKDLAQEFGLDRPGTAQSLLWHYEKGLYTALGSPSKALLRSDGTARYLEEKGIDHGRKKGNPADERGAYNGGVDRMGADGGRQRAGDDGGVGEAGGKTSAQVPAKRTARPPVGDPEDTPLLARAPGPVWYSQLQKAIESKAMPAKAPADQIRAILRNPNSGVKADEVKWTGLDDWLDQQKGSITKEAILDYLKQNNVVVKEVSYGGARNPKQVQMMERIREINDALIYGTDAERRVLWDERKELQDALTGPIEGAEPTKHSAYKTPGGKDYGELLMTVPERVVPLEWKVLDVEAADQLPNVKAALAGKTYESADGRFQIYDLSARGKGFRVYDTVNRHDVSIDNTQNLPVLQYPTLQAAKYAAELYGEPIEGPRKNFTSTHWAPKNVIAHLRYETRTGPDKQKHFLMVENQSDWGQKGSKQGFVTETQRTEREAKKKAGMDRLAEIKKEIDAIVKKRLAEYAGQFPPFAERQKSIKAAEDAVKGLLTFESSRDIGHHSAWNALREASDFKRQLPARWDAVPELKDAALGLQYFLTVNEEATIAEREANAPNPERDALEREQVVINIELSDNSMNRMVPDMPFSQTWHELVMRRALRHAVENGFDRLSWEEGAVHADRYSLSKVASRVTWSSKSGTLTAFDKSGQPVMSQVVSAEKLPEYIGEEAAKSLLETKPDSVGFHELSGEALRVGDQWPTKFYDKKLPGYGKRLAGKFGSKLEKAEIDLPAKENQFEYFGEDHDEDSFGLAVRGLEDQYEIEVADKVMSAMENGSSFQSAMDLMASSGLGHAAKRLARRIGGDIRKSTSAPTATVWSIPITEEMRDSVMQGQPLFQKTKRPPSMGLFEAADETELAKQDKERLLGQRLTAQFNSEISMQENLSKLKKKPFVQQQHSFFEALPDDDQTSLFLKGMNTPVKILPNGKPDTASAIRDAKIRVYSKGGNRAARVYLNPAAHQIIMQAEIEAGIAKPGNPWLGAAMKPVWMYRIIDEMRSTGKLGSKVNDAELMRKMDELADQLEDAVRDSLNPMSVSLIAAEGAKQDVEAVARHEQQHADQYAVEPRSNFKPAELFGQQNLLKIESNKTYQKAGEGLMSAGYPYKSLPTEVMAHVADGRMDDAGNVMTLGVTPEEGLNLYVDLLEAAVATKGRIAYTLVQNAARPTKQTIRQIRRSRDSRSVQRPNQGGAERGADQPSPRAGRPDGGNSGRSQNIPRTKRPPG